MVIKRQPNNKPADQRGITRSHVGIVSGPFQVCPPWGVYKTTLKANVTIRWLSKIYHIIYKTLTKWTFSKRVPSHYQHVFII